MKSLENLENSPKVADFLQNLRRLYIPSEEIFIDTIKVIGRLVVYADKILPMKSFFNLTRDIQSGEKWYPDEVKRAECTEDVFVAACAFLQLEASRLRSTVYLTGEATNARDSRQRRDIYNLEDEIVLKTISSFLAKPDEERGPTEVRHITSGTNHLAKLVNLHLVLPDFTQAVISKKYRKSAICEMFGLTLHEYAQLMTMARNQKLIVDNNVRQDKEPDNKYSLKAENHRRVLEQAKLLGYTPNRMLNKILSDIFDVIDKTTDFEDDDS